MAGEEPERRFRSGDLVELDGRQGIPNLTEGRPYYVTSQTVATRDGDPGIKITNDGGEEVSYMESFFRPYQER